MELPNADHVIINKEKMTGYLLRLDHPTGFGKADFFLDQGFTSGDWEGLAAALRAHAASGEVVVAKQRTYGVNYVVEGVLETPDGRRPWVRSVWFIESGTSVPRLATAYPCRRRRET